MWPDFIRKYFGFTKQQGRGLFVVLLACFAIVILRVAFSFYPSKSELLIKQVPVIFDDTLKEDKKTPSPRGGHKQKKLISFNPNTVDVNQLQELGFKASSAKALINFRKKGFVFRQKKDLLKVYGVDNDFYNELVPFIVLDSSSVNKSGAQKQTVVLTNNTKPKTSVVELNAADSMDLIQLKGIGPSYAKRILKYRTLLGGFVKTEQLLEVYGLNQELYSSILPFLQLNSTDIQKLNLNTESFKNLNRHPYISYELTKQIVNTRKNLKLNEQVLKEMIEDPLLFEKLLPYCSFE